MIAISCIRVLMFLEGNLENFKIIAAYITTATRFTVVYRSGAGFVALTTATTFPAQIIITICRCKIVTIMILTLTHKITSSHLGHDCLCHHCAFHCRSFHNICPHPMRYTHRQSILHTLVRSDHSSIHSRREPCYYNDICCIRCIRTHASAYSKHYILLLMDVLDIQDSNRRTCHSRNLLPQLYHKSNSLMNHSCVNIPNSCEN